MYASPRLTGAILLAAVVLSGCKKVPAPAEWFGGQPDHGRSRYAGIGIYSPGQPWTRMVAAQQAKETPAAGTIDDQAIIVVVDSSTGEVRSCGDMTGYCVGMNPWKTPLARAQLAPVDLVRSNDPDVTVRPAKSPPHSRLTRRHRSKVAQSIEPQ